MKDYLKRMIAERDELQKRIPRLSSFLEVNFGSDFDARKFILMSRQLGLMIGYLDVLQERIDLEIGEEE